MKNEILLSITVMFCFTTALQAQIEKNDWLLGGTFGFNTANSGPNTIYSNYTSNANIAPHIGYAIGKNSVLGINLAATRFRSSNDFDAFSLTTNALYRKYFPLKNKFGAYLQLSGGIGWSKTKQIFLDTTGNLKSSTYSNRSYSAGVVPGLYYKVNPWLLLNADCGGLDYSYTDLGNKNWNSNLSFNFLSNFTFGVDFILGRNKN